jgi:hypothetical protein
MSPSSPQSPDFVVVFYTSRHIQYHPTLTIYCEIILFNKSVFPYLRLKIESPFEIIFERLEQNEIAYPKMLNHEAIIAIESDLPSSLSSLTAMIILAL